MNPEQPLDPQPIPVGLSLFTDGTRFSHIFVKELFIDEEIWDLVSGTGDMILYQAISAIHPDGPLITLADQSSYNSTTGQYENYFYTNDITSSVLTLQGVGAFWDRKCYMVIQWSEAWIKCGQYNLIVNNVMTFNSLLIKQNCKEISNSPTIGAYLEGLTDTPTLGTVSLPTEAFTRENFSRAITGYQVVNVYSFSDIQNAISESYPYNKVILNIMADIQVSSKITILEGRTVVINGNYHKLFEYRYPYSYSTINDGRRVGPFNGTLEANMGFSTPNGETLLLEKSNVFRADSWPSNPVFNLNANDSINTDIDGVFIHYGAWYQRRINPVVNINNNSHTLAFSIGSLSNAEQAFYNRARTYYTNRPYFFFTNYDNGANPSGVLIKNGQIMYPISYASIGQITIDRLITVQRGAKLEIQNLTLSGSKQFVIVNDGDLLMNGCDLSNKIGGGIHTEGKLFVTNCSFHDILDRGIYANYQMNWAASTYHPYLDVTNCIFTDIGTYGTNRFAIESRVKGYIANNLFEDTNFGAIEVGNISTESTLARDACYNLVEYNTICYTSEWITKRKQLGLQDNGAIYVATNNYKAIIRFNEVLRVGGPDHGDKCKCRAIFCDDGAYNMSIYCNIITHTEWNSLEHYDIDSRDCSAEQDPRPIPNDAMLNDNNTICFNLCDGCFRMGEYGSTIAGEYYQGTCTFDRNIIIRPFLCADNGKYVNKVNGKYHPYTAHQAIVYDHSGSISENGVITSSLNYQQVLGYNHIGRQLSS